MPNDGDLIIEIGPGLGDLTQELLAKNRQVIAYEIDNDLCKILKEKFKNDNFSLKCGDVLGHWRETLIDKQYDLVANLPYYIATNIILKALKDKNCKNIEVLIQKEVAEKFAAKSGDKSFSSLSIISQSVADVEILFDIEPEAFVPAPKVISSVIKFSKFKDSYDEEFTNFLAVCFRQPRKTLFKNLSLKYDKEKIVNVFEKLNLTKSIRSHQLQMPVFSQLFNNLEGDSKNGNTTKSTTSSNSTK